MDPTESNAVAGVGTDQSERSIPMVGVPASDLTRKQIAEILNGDFDKNSLLRHAVRLYIANSED